MDSAAHQDGEVWLKGVPISPGIASARLCLFCEERHSHLVERQLAESELEAELHRLKNAFTAAARRLEQICHKVAREIGKAEAEIFTAQKLIIEDIGIHRKISELVRTEHLNAESAISRILGVYEARLRTVASDHLKERATDIAEAKRRLLDILAHTTPRLRCETEGYCRRGRGRIVAARELAPSLTVELDTEHLLGLITEHGGITSHAAILARALGIPAVSGLPSIHGTLRCGMEVVVNGHTGEVVLNPTPATVTRLTVQTAVPDAVEALDPVPGMRIMANISRTSDLPLVKQVRAEGIGLYRTEFEFMAANRLLTEDEQVERYSAVLLAMRGQPVYFRLLDLGGDKPASFLDLPHEENPALGFRGARFLLGNLNLLQDQVRAIGRASRHGPVHLMYPMIVDVEQFLKLKGIVMAALAGTEPGTILHGVMFEIPAACLQARELLTVADFGSIGTNDLFQYLYAVDRNNERVAADFTPDKPIFWSVIAGVVRAAEETGKSLSVCGEIAGWPEYILKLRDSGVRTVSVSARMISRVRKALLTHSSPSGTTVP